MCITLQHIASKPLFNASTRWNALHRTASHCITLHHTASHCNALQNASAYYGALQRTATHCNALQNASARCIKALDQNIIIHFSNMALSVCV